MSKEKTKELYDLEKIEKEYKQLRANEVESEFVGIVENVYWRADRWGNDCLFMQVKIPDKGRLIIKYTKTWIAELARHLRVLGFKNLKELEGCRFQFKLTPTSRGYPRHIPIKRVDSSFTTADKLIEREGE